MLRSLSNSRYRACISLCAALLFFFELVFLPLPGLEGDEVLFVLPFLKGSVPLYSWHAGSLHIPVMSMDYIGALKSWLYWPVFHFWRPGIWSIRLPACAISLLTLVLFADVVRRAAGNITALLAVAFLATDASFVLTNVFDWGPVALLLCGSVACVNLLQRYAARGETWMAGVAMLIAGAAMWYKAIFVFPLAALIAATIVVYFRELRQSVSRRTIIVMLACFAAGISPLIAFNLARGGATILASGYIGSAPLKEKALMMERTLDGRALEHLMFRSFANERLPLNGKPLPILVESWYRESTLGPGSALAVLLVLALFALPFVRGSDLFRPLLFAWLACICTFGLMAGFRDAGAGPHHTLLIYPAPHFIVAATLVALCQRVPRAVGPALAAATLLVLSNLCLLNQYREAAARHGFSVYWTSASAELTNRIVAENLPAAFLDWGIREVVGVQAGDRVRYTDSTAPREGVLYVSHCDGYVIDGEPMEAFEKRVRASGLQLKKSGAVTDSQGAALFCMSVISREGGH
jgi:4-amino-4-deoxy-L-arabinose transferase-like glycosyltransferase